MSASTFVGTILASAPDFGVALVFKSFSTPALTDLVIARFPYGDSRYGAIPHTAYPTGTSVVCRMIERSSRLAHIIGPANDTTSDREEGNLGKSFYNVDPFTTGDAKTPITVLDSLLSSTSHWFDNFAHGTNRDILPGDYDIVDRQGLTGFHIGRFLTQLRGSAIAYADVSGVTHAVRLVGDILESHTLTTEDIADADLGVSNRALNINEAFGLAEGPIMQTVDDDSDIELVSDTAIPLYRMQHLEGATVGGVEDLIVGFPDGAEEHTSETEPTILSKRRSSLSGELLDASAFGISSIKAPYIAGVHQLGYGHKPIPSEDPDEGQEGFDDLREPFELDYEEPEDRAAAPDTQAEVDDAALNKLIETLTSADYIERLQEKMAEKGLCISTLEGSPASKFDDQDLDKGPTSQQQYKLPSYLNIKDPATGETKHYFASTSYITQEPDGSVLIGDGYGSEIRMSRGNIIISPALDLIQRPGRDLSAVVPGHLSMNSQTSVTLNSSGTMHVRACDDLKIVGATEGVGVVTLESKAKGGKGTPGGMVIKSDRNLSVTGEEVYIGRNAHVGNDKNTVSEPMYPGSIIIDAGANGVIAAKSGAFTADSGEIILGALKGVNNSALVISQYRIGVYAMDVMMPSHLVMGPMEGTPTVSVLRGGDLEEVALTVQPSSYITNSGGMFVGTNVICNGQGQFNKGLGAKTLMSSNGKVGGVKEPEEVFKQREIGPFPVPQNMGENASRIAKRATNSVYQDHYVMSNGFAFPTYQGVPSYQRVPGMRWQISSAEGDTVYVWEEQYIKDI